MSDLLDNFEEVLRDRLPYLQVVSDDIFVRGAGINVEFPDNSKVISAWMQKEKRILHVFFESLNREAWEHDAITSITPVRGHHTGRLHVIGQNVVDITLSRYYKEPTLLNGRIKIQSVEVARNVAHMLADATYESYLKNAHLFMLGNTALPVPTRNMWVRRVAK